MTQPGTSYLSQSDRRPHFGLAAATTIQRLEIRWPDGTERELNNLRADQFLTIRQNDSSTPALGGGF